MNDSYDREVAEKILAFMLDYYAMIRRHIVEKNEIRFHSHGFYLLNILESNKDELLTMSACANQMSITKQQLTKIVDLMEGQGYVVRSHDENNRRQIRLSITPEGENYLGELRSMIIAEIIRSLDKFSTGERAEIMDCAKRFSEIFKNDKARNE